MTAAGLATVLRTGAALGWVTGLTACDGRAAADTGRSDAASERAEPARPADVRTPEPARARATFIYDTSAASAYVAEIWDPAPARQAAAVTHARGTPPGPTPPRAVLVLRAYHGDRVVRFTRWDDASTAAAYAAAARLAPPAGVPAPRYVEELRVRTAARKADQPLAFDTTTAAQFSQFTMRRRSAVDTLQAMAAGMSGGMVQAEPTLRLISTLTAQDSSVVAFVGVWDSPKGFDIFAERKTFSARPYWEPYAGNEHHMMAVVAAATRP